jgi:hypothetical protein
MSAPTGGSGSVLIAGVRIDAMHVLRLPALLREHGFEHTALNLERTFDAASDAFALTSEEREQILRCLEDTSDAQLGGLRAVLVQEHSGRQRDGLV